MDYTPDLHMMESRKHDKLGWPAALSELIDNSFDAGATRVEIEIAGRRLTVSDDGIGTTDIPSMVRFGSHRRHKTTSLGTYGVGLKDAWLYLSNRIEINSVCDGVRSRLSVDYAKDLQKVDGKWVGPDPVTEESVGAKSGTAISFDPLHASRKKPLDETFEKLGFTFMPALLDGRQIVAAIGKNRKLVKPYKIPAMAPSVDDTFEIDGKQVSISIGVATSDATIRQPGFCLCYGHRVLNLTTIGTGQYTASRMVGKIMLGPNWKLTPHKDDLSDYSEQLEDEIFRRIEPLLQSAEKLGEDIASNLLRTELEDDLNCALRGAKAKEKRNPSGDSEGSIAPKHTGRTRAKAEKFDETLPGSVDVGTGRRKRGIKLDWCTIEPERIGCCDQLSSTVSLNVANDFIAHAKATNNREALVGTAIGILCHDFSNSDGRTRFIFEKRDFIAAWGLVMNSLSFGGNGNAK